MFIGFGVGPELGWLERVPEAMRRVSGGTAVRGGEVSLRTIKFTYWKDGEFFLGYLNDYPDYQSQGFSKEELTENLKSLLADIESGEVPYIRKVEELVVAG